MGWGSALRGEPREVLVPPQVHHEDGCPKLLETVSGQHSIARLHTRDAGSTGSRDQGDRAWLGPTAPPQPGSMSLGARASGAKVRVSGAG